MSTVYEKIRRNYPSVISGEQLCKICRISKRKGKWLLENGVIPFVDTGKQTHRYLIQLDDAIRYLKKKRRTQSADEPRGIFSGREAGYTPLCSPEAAQRRLTALWACEPDALTFRQAAALAGYTNGTVLRWIKKEKLMAVPYFRDYMIPKTAFIEWLAVKTQENPKFLSKRHIELLKGAEETSVPHDSDATDLACAK